MPSRSLRHLTLFGLTALGACASADPTAEVRDIPPAALTVAVAPLSELPPASESAELRMSADALELQELLIASLRSADAASRVVRLDELTDPSEADVVLTTAVSEPVDFSHEGVSGDVWASGGLWLFTWIGGLAVDDSSYSARMVLDCSFENPRTTRSVVHQAQSASVELSSLERNGFFSWSTAQAIIIPPFWTSDATDSTSETLTLFATQSIAADVARFLKREFENAALLNDYCQVRIQSPENGAELEGDSVRLAATVTALGEYEISKIIVLANGKQQHSLQPMNERDPFGGTHTAKIDVPITGLQDGENYIRLRITAGQEYTRTLRVGQNAAK